MPSERGTGLTAVTFLITSTSRVSCEQGCTADSSGQPVNLCPVTKGVNMVMIEVMPMYTFHKLQ